MTEETAKKVSELYDEKSKLSKLYSTLLKKGSLGLTFREYTEHLYWCGSERDLLWNVPEDILSDLQEIVRDKIKFKMTEVDLKIAKVNCI